MSKSSLCGIIAVASLLLSTDAAAQFANPVRFNVHAGASVPVGDFADDEGGLAELGFRVGAGLELRPVLSPVGLRFDGAYDRMNLDTDGTFDLAYSIWNLTANAVFAPTASPLYFIGGIGFYGFDLAGDDVDEFEAFIGEEIESQTEFGFNLGAGFNLPLTGFSTFVEARWHNINTEGDNVTYIPIVFGIRF